MKPERGLFAPMKVAFGIGMSIATRPMPSAWSLFEITGPNSASVWNSIT